MLITVEAVSDKFKNKFNSGSIKVNGKWLQISPKLDVKMFPIGQQVDVETVTNDKGYTSIKNINAEPKLEKTTTESVTKSVEVTSVKVNQPVSYEDSKNKRILTQGIVQAVVQSPSLAGLPFTNVEDVITNVTKVSDELIKWIEEQIK